MTTGAASWSEPHFYCASLAAGQDTLELTGDEAHHALGVQRLRLGDGIVVFDGRGTAVRGVITRAQPRERALTIEIRERRYAEPPAPPAALYCALPKGDRLAVLLDMATQLGMQRFTPLRCARSVVEPPAETPERWRRICLEACKQSRNPHLPVLEPALTPLAAAQSAGGLHLLVAQPGASTRPAELLYERPAALALFVGPEGGFTAEEIEVLEAHGARPITLGPNILRIETAAVALLSAVALGR